MKKPSHTQSVSIVRFREKAQPAQDTVSIEEPLEIVLRFVRDGVAEEFPLAVTMRTPGDDEALALGFLLTEGIIESLAQVEQIQFTGPHTENFGLQNRIEITLAHGHQLDLKRFQRHFFTNSSCGVCGKTSIQALSMLHEPNIDQQQPVVASAILTALPDTLLTHQLQFSQTGGIHAAGLFSPEGTLLAIAEDIGRHNAMDKLIGDALQRKLPTTNALIVVSGRASFELVQKTLMAGVPFLAAVGAPSSLAIDLAAQYGMTLVGFLKAKRFNCYSGEQRIT